MSEYNIFSYGAMMADQVRMGPYRAALQQTVKPGSVVLDIGSGQGVFSLLACQFGASHVYAIETNEVIHTAREIAKRNGFANRITFIQEDSRKVTLPAKADVLVSDLRGVLPIYGTHLSVVIDARQRLLKPSGIQIPQKDTLFAAIASTPADRAHYVSGYSNNYSGLDFSPALTIATSEPWKVALQANSLVSAPIELVAIDYSSDSSFDVERSLTFTTNSASSADGILLWFETVLLPGIGFSTAPGNQTVYGQGLLPWPKAVDLAIGDIVQVKIASKLFGDKVVWVWNTAISRDAKLLCSFDQSSLPSDVLSPTRLRQLSGK